MHPSPLLIRRQVGLAKVHPCTEFVVASSKLTCKFGISGAYYLACRGRKKQYVKIICTCTARAQCATAPYFIRRKVGIAKVDQSAEFGVAS